MLNYQFCRVNLLNTVLLATFVSDNEKSWSKQSCCPGSDMSSPVSHMGINRQIQWLIQLNGGTIFCPRYEIEETLMGNKLICQKGKQTEISFSIGLNRRKWIPRQLTFFCTSNVNVVQITYPCLVVNSLATCACIKHQIMSPELTKCHVAIRDYT